MVNSKGYVDESEDQLGAIGSWSQITKRPGDQSLMNWILYCILVKGSNPDLGKSSDWLNLF